MADNNEPQNEEKPLSELAGEGSSKGFYRGFDKPDPMKVNLAGEHQDYVPGAMSGTIDVAEEEKPQEEPAAEQLPEPAPEKPTTPVEPKIETPIQEMATSRPFTPAKPPRQPMNIRWNVILAMFFGGILGAAILGAICYFGIGFYYQSKLNTKQTDLNNLENQKTSLGVAPRALEPTVQEVPASSAPEPTPAETPTPAPAETEQPIQQEQPTTPPSGGNG